MLSKSKINEQIIKILENGDRIDIKHKLDFFNLSYEDNELLIIKC